MDSKPLAETAVVKEKPFKSPESEGPEKVEITLLGTRGSYTVLVVALRNNGKGCKGVPVLIVNETTNERTEAKTDDRGFSRQDITVTRTMRIRVWVGFISNTNPRQFTLYGPRTRQAPKIDPSTTARGFLAPFFQGIKEGLEAKRDESVA